MKKTFTLIAVTFLALGSVGAFQTMDIPTRTCHRETTTSATALAAASPSSDNANSLLHNRKSFLSHMARFIVPSAVLIATTSLPANAAEKEIDPAIKGTKKDPGYEACVSKCMYTCTKPKGMEQISRSECLPVCKKECATTKAQLMVGTPLN